MSPRAIKGRTLTSLILTGSFLVMAVSGLIAYIQPHGRIAYWTDWSLLGLSKTQWTNMHIASALVFLLAGGFHVYFNWKPLMNYLSAKVEGMLRSRRELAIASLLTLAVVLSGVWPYPPFNWAFDLSEAAKAAWVSSPQYEPPFGHAEELAFSTFCKKTGLDPDQAREALRGAGILMESPTQRLIDIARANHTNPMALYELMRPAEKPRSVVVAGAGAAAGAASGQGRAYTALQVEETFAGTGIGRKTLGQIAAQTGQSAGEMGARLRAAGLRVEPDEALKSAADRLGLSPIELLKVMLVDGYRPGN